MEGSSRDLLTSGIVGENVHVYKQNGSTKKVRKYLLLYCNNQKIHLCGEKYKTRVIINIYIQYMYITDLIIL